MDTYQAIQALSLRGVGIGITPSGNLSVNAPAELMTEDLRGWFRESKAPFLAYFKGGKRLLVKPPPLAVIPSPTADAPPAPDEVAIAPAPSTEPPPAIPPACESLPDLWTAPGFDPRLFDAIDRAIKAEAVSEILEFHRAIRGGRP